MGSKCSQYGKMRAILNERDYSEGLGVDER